MKEKFNYKKESGQALVEWALVFPLFLLIICIIMDFSWICYQNLMFESAYRSIAWDFPVNLINSSGGSVTDTDIIAGNLPVNYGKDAPGNVVKPLVGPATSLGAGIREHVLESTWGALDASCLKVLSAKATFDRMPKTEIYQAGGKAVSLETYELQMSLEVELEYDVKILTPVSKVFFPSGMKTLTKKVKRNRIERVVINRRVVG